MQPQDASCVWKRLDNAQPFWELHMSSPVASVAVSLETTRSYCTGNGLEGPVERQGTECSWSLVHRVGGIL